MTNHVILQIIVASISNDGFLFHPLPTYKNIVLTLGCTNTSVNINQFFKKFLLQAGDLFFKLMIGYSHCLADSIHPLFVSLVLFLELAYCSMDFFGSFIQHIPLERSLVTQFVFDFHGGISEQPILDNLVLLVITKIEVLEWCTGAT